MSFRTLRAQVVPALGTLRADGLRGASERVSAGLPGRSAARILPGRGMNPGLCTLQASVRQHDQDARDHRHRTGDVSARSAVGSVRQQSGAFSHDSPTPLLNAAATGSSACPGRGCHLIPTSGVFRGLAACDHDQGLVENTGKTPAPNASALTGPSHTREPDRSTCSQTHYWPLGLCPGNHESASVRSTTGAFAARDLRVRNGATTMRWSPWPTPYS
jgi:hypothetical protein